MSIVLDALNKAENEHKKRSGKVIGAEFDGHKIQEIKKQYKSLFIYILLLNLFFVLLAFMFFWKNTTEDSLETDQVIVKPSVQENIIILSESPVDDEVISVPKESDPVSEEPSNSEQLTDNHNQGFKVVKNTLHFEDGESHVISGIFKNADGMSIMLSDEFLKIGDTFKTIKIKDVNENKVLVEHEGKLHEIKV